MRIKFHPIGLALLLAYFVMHIFIYFPQGTTALRGGGGGRGLVADPVPVSDGPTVRKDERWPLVTSEFGDVSAVKISDGKNGFYYLHFITMYPGSLFLPVYLHSEMVLYVNSGIGTLSWINAEKDDDKLQQVTLRRGDVYRLSTKTVFYLQNHVESYPYQPQNLQIHAIFPGSEEKLQNDQLGGVYTGVQDLVLGFDNQVLQSTFNAPEEVIEELRAGEQQPLIVEGRSEACTWMWDDGSWSMKALLGTNKNDIFNVANKKKKKLYNIFREDHDVETCFGWSVTVTSKKLDALKDTDFGVFMVNLTKGSIMAPHWNPNSVEVAIVLHGQGVVEVVCPGIAGETTCTNSRLRVDEGDVFVVPRDHPMAQISFNNESFVFMGFMLTQKKESPQFLAGKLSILQRLDRKVLARSFNARNTTIDWVLSNQNEEIIYECVSCAEEEVSRRGKGRGGGEGRGSRWQDERGRRGGGGEQQEERGTGGGGGGWQGDKGGMGGVWPEERGGGSGWQEERGGGSGWQEEGGQGGGGGWKAM